MSLYKQFIKLLVFIYLYEGQERTEIITIFGFYFDFFLPRALQASVGSRGIWLINNILSAEKMTPDQSTLKTIKWTETG